MADHNVNVKINTSADTSAVDKMKSSLASVQKQIDVLVSHTGLLKSNNELLAQSWAELDSKTRSLQSDLSNLSKDTQEYAVKNVALNDTIKLQNETYSELRKNRTEIASNERMINALQKEVSSHSGITDEISKENSSMKGASLTREAYIKGVEEWTKKSHEAREALIKLRSSQSASDEEIKKAQNNLLIARRNLKEYKQGLKESTDQLGFFQSSLVKVNKKLKEQFALAAAKKLLTMARQLFSYVSHQLVEQGLALDKVKDQFSILTRRVGADAIEMRNAMRTASLGLVSDVDLMTSANKALELGVVKTTGDMETLMKIATVRGREMGEEVSKAFDDIVVGLGRMSPRILDNLGIIVSQSQAYEEYAKKVGKTTKELSKAEQQQAMFDAVVKASKVQLEQWGTTSLSIADKLTVLEVKAKNSFATVGAAFLQWFEPMIDFALEELDKLTSSIDDGTQLINGSWTWLWDNVVVSLKSIGESFATAWNYIQESVSGVVNTLGDLLGGLFNGVTGGSQDSATNMQRVFIYSLNAIGRMVESLSIAFSTLWDIASKGVKTVVNRGQKTWNSLKIVGNTIKGGFLYGIGDEAGADKAAQRIMEIAQAKPVFDDNQIKSWEQIVADATIKVGKLGDQIMEVGAQVEGNLMSGPKNYFEDLNAVVQKLQGGMDDLTSGGGSSKSGKSKKDEELEALKKEMEEYGKETKKLIEERKKYLKSLDDFARDRLNKQKELIDDLNDEYQKKFDEIQKKIEATEKEIEKLNEAIADLKQKMADLKGEETKALADEIIKARKELKGLEEQYEGLAEVANSVSMGDLEGVGGVGKFDVDLIKKYKTYKEELDTMYQGMSASEQEALNKELEYAEWYDSLNGIEKIKEDYRIRQEEIQNELNEKLDALATEQATLRQYKREQQKLQDERIKRIEEEVLKYKDMYDKVIAFEQKYMDKIEEDHFKQIQMTERLIDQWNAVYRAKMRALSAGSDDGERAIGGSVSKGKSYLVGEMGPELFIPSSNGRIVNNSDLNKDSGGIEINVNMGGVVVSNDIELEEMANMVSEKILRDVQLYKRGIL